MHSRRRFIAFAATAPFASAPLLSTLAHAQAPWAPARPVTMIIPYPAGGPMDVVGRLVGAEIGKDLGQPVVVENVAGASGAIASKRAAGAAADGQTLIIGNNQTHATNVSLLPQGGGYDPVREFVPVAGLADLQHLLVVREGLPVTSVAELMALAKKDPAALTCGSTGVGSASHLALELFKSRTGLDIVHVPYKGSSPLLQDLLAGQVNMSFATTPTVLGQVKAGKLRALAVASPTRSPHLPQVPTLAEAGVKGVEADAWAALFLPAATPAPIVARYRKLVDDAMHQERVRAAITDAGMSVNLRDGAAFATFVAADVKRWADVIRTANVKLD